MVLFIYPLLIEEVTHMPRMERDGHSGAIVFHLTEDEQAVKDLKDQLLDMQEVMKYKLAQLDQVLKASKGGSKA